MAPHSPLTSPPQAAGACTHESFTRALAAQVSCALRPHFPEPVVDCLSDALRPRADLDGPPSALPGMKLRGRFGGETEDEASGTLLTGPAENRGSGLGARYATSMLDLNSLVVFFFG